MKEAYISVDVETSGQTPIHYSLLSLGACVVHHRDATFYAELKPDNDMFDRQAMEVNGLSLENLMQTGKVPYNAINEFVSWLINVKKSLGVEHLIFASFSTFDWLWVRCYLAKYSNPNEEIFGHSSLEMKSYYMGLFGVEFWQTTKSKMFPMIVGTKKHTHNALDDAIEQAEILERMIEYNQKKIDTWILNDTEIEKYLKELKK